MNKEIEPVDVIDALSLVLDETHLEHLGFVLAGADSENEDALILEVLDVNDSDFHAGFKITVERILEND